MVNKKTLHSACLKRESSKSWVLYVGSYVPPRLIKCIASGWAVYFMLSAFFVGDEKSSYYGDALA
jgi:hypothetical protein